MELTLTMIAISLCYIGYTLNEILKQITTKEEPKVMKNLYVLPTEKPSRLIFNSFHKSFCYQKEIDGMYINDGKVSGADFWGLQKALNNGFKPQNIYITNDEEIKEGDWFYNSFLNEISKMDVLDYSNFRQKIILTTDQDLIADGVQAIDDEFFEWFVKNLSCEEVEVDWVDFSQSYFIKIPKEELKQETLEEDLDEIKNIRLWLKDRKQRFIKQLKK